MRNGRFLDRRFCIIRSRYGTCKNHNAASISRSTKQSCKQRHLCGLCQINQGKDVDIHQGHLVKQSNRANKAGRGDVPKATRKRPLISVKDIWSCKTIAQGNHAVLSSFIHSSVMQVMLIQGRPAETPTHAKQRTVTVDKSFTTQTPCCG